MKSFKEYLSEADKPKASDFALGTKVKSFLQEESPSNSSFLGVVKHKDTGAEHDVHTHPAGTITIKNKSNGTKTVFKNKKDLEQKHDWVRFASKNEAVETVDEGFTTHKPDSYTADLEGTVTPIHKAKLSLIKGFDGTEDKDGYSPTHMIKCSKTGSIHTAYTRNGELRIRPYGKVSAGVTAELVKHLTPGIDKEKTSRE